MSPSTTTGQATVRGARIAFDTAGSGPWVVWGHGLSMNRASDAAMALIDWTRVPARVVRYDARGHGESQSTPDLGGYSWAELARDQLALCDHLGIDRYVPAGASMGCGTALHTAVLAPERTRGLVLVIPPTAWETRAAQAAQWSLTADVIEREGVEGAIAARAQLELPDPFKPDEERRRRLQAEATRAWDPVRLALVMRGAAGADFPSRREVAAVAVPTLILAWSGDAVHPRTTAEELNDLLPDSELHVASTPVDLDTWPDLVAAFLGRLGS